MRFSRLGLSTRERTYYISRIVRERKLFFLTIAVLISSFEYYNVSLKVLEIIFLS